MKTETERYLSWGEVQNDADRLVEKIRDPSQYGGMLCITRGGLYPALILSHRLSASSPIKRIGTLGIESYGENPGGVGEVSGRLRYVKPIDVQLLESLSDKKLLIVDDICDTGLTVRAVRDCLTQCGLRANDIDVACLYVKPLGKSYTTYYGVEYPQNTWLEFPWYPQKAESPRPVVMKSG